MGRPFVARIGANESVFGPSPQAVAAMAEAAAGAWRYGDPENFELKAALAAHHGVAPANVAVGEGIDGLLGNLVRLLVAPGTPVVTSAGAYPTFAYHVAGFGGRLVTRAVPRRRRGPGGAAARGAQGRGAAGLSSPTPTTRWGAGSTARGSREMVARLPGGCVLCLDEAYADFAPADAIPPLDAGEARVIRMRTFSKAHGMAGARIGYALGPPGADRRLRPGAQPFRRQPASPRPGRWRRWPTASGWRRWCARWRRRGAASPRSPRRNGLRALPSATNFVDDRLRPRRRVRAGGCWRGWSRAASSCACRSSRRRTAASGSRPARTADLDAFAAALPEALAAG